MAHPVTFLSGARGEDALANDWLRQVTPRLRREICWIAPSASISSGHTHRW